MIDYAIHTIEPFRARDLAGAVGMIYRDAYGFPDDDVRAFVTGTFARHVMWPEFRLLVATVADIPVAFIYGYRSLPGQWWYDTIRPRLLADGLSGWQDDARELAEIAVHPQVQRQGIGRALITAFLQGGGNRHVLLSTETDSPAHALYRSFGFVDLMRGFRYPGFDDDTTIMGLEVRHGDTPREG